MYTAYLLNDTLIEFFMNGIMLAQTDTLMFC